MQKFDNSSKCKGLRNYQGSSGHSPPRQGDGISRGI